MGAVIGLYCSTSALKLLTSVSFVMSMHFSGSGRAYNRPNIVTSQSYNVPKSGPNLPEWPLAVKIAMVKLSANNVLKFENLSCLGGAVEMRLTVGEAFAFSLVDG